MNYVTKVVLTQVSIAAIYSALNLFSFVISNQPDPIGTGLRGVAMMLIHLIATLVLILTSWRKMSVKERRYKIWINIVVITVVLIMVPIVSDAIMRWLW
jgi:hypothetical protein